jgi:hydrogenase nickel incorporation protein HypB
MCATCGCGHGDVKIEGHDHHHDHGDGHHHHHYHDHDHEHGHHHEHHDHDHDPESRILAVERDLLEKNNALAAENRAFFARRGILALNLVSSPGSGKTELLVKTIAKLSGKLTPFVIEGDQQTVNDATRIRSTGAAAIQINTGKGCHLDAHMVGHALEHLEPSEGSAVFIENVGNLVCPAGFDLGEAHKVVILSVTEGDDKPLKYPDIFAASDLVLINKTDLLPYVDFDMEKAAANAQRIRPGIKVLSVSARTGEGLDDWLAWLMGARAMMLAGHPLERDQEKREPVFQSDRATAERSGAAAE